MITFKYDIKKDAYNWVRKIIFQSPFGIKKNLENIPLDIRKKIEQVFKKSKISHKQLLSSIKHPSINVMTKYLRKTQDTKKIMAVKNNIERSWRKIEKEYFKILSRIFKKPLYKAPYTCYLTTQYGCPYDEKENWFMVSIFSELPTQLYIICHEFMHLQFLYWYRKYCLKKGLEEKQIQDIKEALTFLLNEHEFNKIISFKDQGYPDHQQLRTKLKKIWKKDKNFKNLLDKAIDYSR